MSGNVRTCPDISPLDKNNESTCECKKIVATRWRGKSAERFQTFAPVPASPPPDGLRKREKMTGIFMKAALLGPQKQLLELMQSVNFGRIEGLRVRAGKPTFEPSPRIVRDVKLGGGENGPRAELAREDFALKQQVIEVFDRLNQLADGSVVVIHVQHGLPCRLTVEEPA